MKKKSKEPKDFLENVTIFYFLPETTGPLGQGPVLGRRAGRMPLKKFIEVRRFFESKTIADVTNVPVGVLQ